MGGSPHQPFSYLKITHKKTIYSLLPHLWLYHVMYSYVFICLCTFKNGELFS